MDIEFQLQAIAWKKTEDYSEGLRLFRQRYGETITYKMLCLGTGDFNRAKLRDSILLDVPEQLTAPVEKKKPARLGKLEESVGSLESDVDDLRWTVSDLADKLEEIQQVPQATTVSHPVEIPENEPEEIRKIRQTTYGHMNERTLLKQQLRDLPDPKSRARRKEIAYRILEITAELDRLFGMIGYYEEYGRVPEQVDLDAEKIALPKEYLNLRTYISRTSKKLELEIRPDRRAALAEKIETWRKQMQQIELEL